LDAFQVRAGILLRERRDRFCCPPVAFGGFRFAAELMVSSSTRTALAVGLRESDDEEAGAVDVDYFTTLLQQGERY
jgi:hypothetical protein